MPGHRRYTREQKATAIIAAEAVNTRAAAQAQGVPESTLRYWLESPKFAELRAQTRADMAAGMTTLAHLAAARIVERLPEFEPRDLVILLGVAIDKAQLLSGQATERTETVALTDGMDDHERAQLRAILDDALTEAPA